MHGKANKKNVQHFKLETGAGGGLIGGGLALGAGGGLAGCAAVAVWVGYAIL